MDAQEAAAITQNVSEREIPARGDDPRSALEAIQQQVEREFKESGGDIHDFARRLERMPGANTDTSDFADQPRAKDGTFAPKGRNSAAIEDAEEASQKGEQPESRQPRAERPAARTAPPVADAAGDSSSAPTKIRTTDGRELTLEQVEAGLKLADRAVRLDKAFIQRREELEQRERALGVREQTLRDVYGNERRGAPQARAQVQEDVVDDVPAEDDDVPMTRAQFRREMQAQAARIRDEMATEQMQREEYAARDTYVANYRQAIDTLAKRVVMEQFPELKDDEQGREDMEVLIGRDLGRSVRAGHISLPWYQDERGNVQYRPQHSSVADIHEEFKLHAGARARAIRDAYNKRFATDLAVSSTQSRKTTPPSRGAATVAPGAHRTAENTKVHENIEDLINDIEAIEKEYERSGSDFGFAR